MRTMRRIMNAVASAAVCALTLTGCSREVAEKEYGAVKFGFSAAPTATRTQFQYDATPSGRGITSEHVYWKNGDAVTVCSDVAMNVSGTSHSAVYTVSSSSDDKTKVPASSADGLRWQGDGTHKFFAVYGSDTDVNMTKATGSMPATQSLVWNTEKTVGKAPMEYGFMVSTKASVKSDVVELQFNQIYTAFQFTVGSGDNAAVSLTSFTLSSTSAALAGGFEVDYNATTPTAISRATDAEPTKSITVTFPKTGNADFQVVKNAPVTFTVLALAQPLETMTNLSIEFTGPEIGTRKLALKANGGDGEFIQFAPGTKHIINGLSFPNLLEATGEDIIWEQTAVGEEIAWQNNDYVLGRVNPYDLTYLGGTSVTGRVISYNKTTGDPVAWTVLGYYPTEADAQAETRQYSSLPSWVTSYPEFGAGSSSTDGQVVSIVYNESEHLQDEVVIGPTEINAEIASSTFGLDSSPDCYFNLAYPTNKLSDKIYESANSYVINGPGYYRIPMVMGNGVKRNALNTASYTKVSGSEAKNFKNHADEVVSNPLLQKSNSTYSLTSAYVVWESTDGLIETTGTLYELPSVSGSDPDSPSPFTITEATLNGSMDEEVTSGGDNVYWLNFHVAKGEQGNAIIAVTDGTTVIWSYHIWVTNYICRNEKGSQDIEVKLNPNRTTFIPFTGKVDTWYTLMPLNLGWLYEGEHINAIEYLPNTMYVRIQQAESGKIAIMEVNRPGHHVVTQYGEGNAPYYQWGRKDPFMPADEAGGGRNKKYTAVQSTGETYGTGIQNPGTFYKTPYNSPSPALVWCSEFPAANAWNASINQVAANMTTTSTGTSNNTALNDYIRNHEVVKTIYDPSPAGYSVPTYGAFSFRTDDLTQPTSVNYSSTNGWAKPTNVPFNSSGGRYGASDLFPNIYKINSFEDYMLIIGVKDGIESNSFYGYGFYSNTEVGYIKNNSNVTYPSTITGSGYIFFPALGFRSYYSGLHLWKDSGESHQSGRRGYYWSDMAHDKTNGRAFDIEHYWSNDDHYFNVKNWSNWPSSDGCYVRPMQNDN